MGNIGSKHLPFTKYLFGQIYKITCNITGEIYVGSTILTLENRLSRHKYFNGPRNCTSIQIIARNDYTMELIEDYPC
jgi:hypothetical protein